MNHIHTKKHNTHHRQGRVPAEIRLGIEYRQGVAGNQDDVGSKGQRSQKGLIENTHPLGWTGQGIVPARLLRPGVEVGDGDLFKRGPAAQALDDFGTDRESAHP